MVRYAARWQSGHATPGFIMPITVHWASAWKTATTTSTPQAHHKHTTEIIPHALRKMMNLLARNKKLHGAKQIRVMANTQHIPSTAS
jgi:hypothetical protein